MLMGDSYVSLSLGSYKFLWTSLKLKHCTSSSGKMIITVEDTSYHVSVSIKEATHNGSLIIVNSSLPESNFLINSFRLFSVSFYIFSINLNSFLVSIKEATHN